VDLTDVVTGYYESPAVRARVLEYCGEACGLARYGGRRRLHQPDGAPVPADGSDPARRFDDGVDVCRSLADRGGAIVQLDVDYSNPSDPAEPYRQPERCFARLEPVYGEVTRAFAALGIEPSCLLTGRGYHFTLRAPLDSPLHRDLVASGRLGGSLRVRYDARAAAEPNSLARGYAHDGTGRLLEHFAHGVMRRLRGRTEVPVTLADVPAPGRGAFICLDLTAYADPAFSRSTRCAFSTNQKAGMMALDGPPFVIVLPRSGRGLDELLRARHDPAQAARLAEGERTVIPDFGEAAGWRTSYERGPLGRFHREFDRGPDVDAAGGGEADAGIGLARLPACVRLPLEHPNPLLLVPLYLRSVALALWGLGWHPRSVARLICARYRRDFGWSGLWERFEPCARAEFYVRVFCGLAACGLEDEATFDCASQAARGGCPASDCGHDLGRLFPHALAPAAGGSA